MTVIAVAPLERKVILELKSEITDVGKGISVYDRATMFPVEVFRPACERFAQDVQKAMDWDLGVSRQAHYAAFGCIVK